MVYRPQDPEFAVTASLAGADEEDIHLLSEHLRQAFKDEEGNPAAGVASEIAEPNRLAQNVPGEQRALMERLVVMRSILKLNRELQKQKIVRVFTARNPNPGLQNGF